MNQTPASYQTREAILEFVDKSKKYDLAKAEILNIVNLGPITPVEIFPVISPSLSSFHYMNSSYFMLCFLYVISVLNSSSIFPYSMRPFLLICAFQLFLEEPTFKKSRSCEFL